jgi:hypothetical protein
VENGGLTLVKLSWPLREQMRWRTNEVLLCDGPTVVGLAADPPTGSLAPNPALFGWPRIDLLSDAIR